MASAKFASLAFLLLAVCLFEMNKVESISCAKKYCYITKTGECGDDCACFPDTFGMIGICKPKETVAKMVSEHPNLCHSHDECIKKGSGSFCAHYPNADIEYGRCFFSKLEAEDFFVKMTSNSKFTKDFLKMSVTA